MARSVFLLFCAIIICLTILYIAALTEMNNINKSAIKLMEQRDSVIRQNDSLKNIIFWNGK